MKVCSKCKKEKPDDDYYRKSGRQEQYFSACKDCVLRQAAKRYRDKNPIIKARKVFPGEKYSLLTVIKRVENDKRSKSQYSCRCDCGKTRIVVGSELKRKRVKSCGCLNKNGRHKTHLMCIWKYENHGYVYIKIPNHPYATKMGVVTEHRVVMEKHIGRYLQNQETVHHKNGIKTDNRIQNLELWSGKHPSGQRVQDMISFCKKYLSEYAIPRKQAKTLNMQRKLFS